MGSYRQGIFKPQNPKKYKGNVKNIVYRSSWELKYLMDLDRDEDVLEYSSEEVIVPYRDYTNKVRRYFVDFWVKKIVDGDIQEFLIEIKPASQMVPPTTGKKKRKTLIKEILTYNTNQSKWKAAEKYAEKRNMVFEVLNEYDLGIKKRK